MKRAALGLSVLLALSAGAFPAAASIPVPVNDDREASFMPPPVALTPDGTSVATEAPPSVKATPPEATPAKAAESKPLTAPPATLPMKAEVPAKAEAPVTIIEGKKGAVADIPVPGKGVGVALPSAAPVAAAAGPGPSAPPMPAPAVEPVVIAPPAPTVVPTVDLGEPVASAPLSDVDPETMGLLSASNGGLGAAMWKDVSRPEVERLMLATNLPTSSATLNDLMRRLLLSTAALPAPGPDGDKGRRNMTSLRIEKLMALGDVSGAWKLALMAQPGRIDQITLRLLTEAALIGPDSKEICDQVPNLIASHPKDDEVGVEWQKSLIVCQLRANDMKAVQLGLDLLREQKVKDDLFLSLMNRNVLGSAKQLPRQLTPLRALNLAVLRQTGLPLPIELFARPEAQMVAELVKSKAVDEKARLTLAEKSAARGLLSASQLAEVYKSVTFSTQEVQGAFSSNETGPLVRAMLYQALSNEQGPQKKIDLAQKLVANIEASALTGALGQLAANSLTSIQVLTDYNSTSALVARLLATAGKPEQAMAWLKLARGAAKNIPEVATELKQGFPLFVLAGLVADGEYAQGLKEWLDLALASGAEDANHKDRRDEAGAVLVLLSAAGYAVGEDSWARVTDVGPPTKQMVPSAVLVERLKQAGVSGRRGHAALLAAQLAGGGATEVPLSVTAEAVKSLRLAGLTAESQALAREAVVALTSP